MSQGLLSKLLRILGVIRLILIAYLFLFSLLTIIPFNWAERYYFTLTAIEDGGKLCLVCLIIFILPGKNYLPFSKVTRWIPSIAFLLLLHPTIRATIEFTQFAQSDNPTSRHSFSWKHWIFGHNADLDKTDFEIKAADGQTLHAIAFSNHESRAKKNAVLVLHGGSFSAGSAIHGASLAAALAERGWFTLSIEYRLAPKNQYPAQVEDVNLWIDFLKNNTHQFNIDTSTFFLAGESAGATIALNAAYTQKDSSIGAVANLYGITSTETNNSDFFESTIDIAKILNDYRGSHSLSAISPIEQSKMHAIPTISIHGKNDHVVHWKHATELANTLNSLKIKNEIMLLSWSPHIFNHPATGPSGQLTTEYIDRFFRKQLIPIK